LTIRRWGGIDELLGDSAVAETVNAFRAGERAAEKVAWAFVRSRVSGHSPTFDWKNADLNKLVVLVAGCSDEPKLDVAEPVELANALVRAQDEQGEQMRATLTQASMAFARTSEIARRAVLPETAKMITQYQRVAAQALRPMQSIQRAMRELSLQIAVPQMQATQRAMQELSLQIAVPQQVQAEFMQSVRDSFAGARLDPSISDLVMRKVTLFDVARAASAASGVSARHGNKQEAVELAQVARGLSRVAESPSSGNVEALLESVVSSLGAIEDEMKASRREQADRESNREQQEQSRFVIMIYVMIVIFLLQWLLQPQPPAQSSPTTPTVVSERKS
jgi:hypothetical protein